MFIDVAAERMLAAEKGREKIAVEIKTFPNPQAVNDIHPAAGQYVFYRSVRHRFKTSRELVIIRNVRNSGFGIRDSGFGLLYKG